MARRSNEDIIKEAVEEMVSDIVEEIFSTLRGQGVTLSLSTKRDILDGVIKKIGALKIASPDAR